MRPFPFITSGIFTIALILILGTRMALPLALGKFLSPQEGIWQNAEPSDASFDADLKFSNLKGKINVYFDERLVPHVMAEYKEDAFFVQGYLHAKFRLWQMEFQARAAAGRISEIVGEKALNYDRNKRREGMVYGAEAMLKEMEANPLTKAACNNYTAGVNAYIASLTNGSLPVEYKLLGYEPEKWDNLKIALMGKELTATLTWASEDLSMTRAKAYFSDEEMKVLFPDVSSELDPIVPRGSTFDPPTVFPKISAHDDSIYLYNNDSTLVSDAFKPDPDNGSNNWAVSGSKTQSGAPILCNDPHLDLSLPSIWYEMQISTPEMNVYGASLPGLPCVLIGFNDSIAFGFTNAERDVKDYYAIQFKDSTKRQYWFDKDWKNTGLRIEKIGIKGKPEVFDTVAYTVFGPVMYDKSFSEPDYNYQALAVRWRAHDPSNELLMFYKLNQAKNYQDYYDAIQYDICPGQNVAFASKSGDIAIWQQGSFPARWNRQGLYVMPGYDSTYMWQGFIPSKENPHLINPIRGFVSSANQRPTDSAYPYYIPGGYLLYRGVIINRKLNSMNAITPKDMMDLQTNNYNAFAEAARPFFLKYLNDSALSTIEKKYLDLFVTWNLDNNVDEKAPTIFNIWCDSLQHDIWDDEFSKTGVKGLLPAEETLVAALIKDPDFHYVDDINTAQRETIFDQMTKAFKKACKACLQLELENKLEWGVYKNTSVYHLLGEAALPFSRTNLPIGGGEHIINAAKHRHGPSWRMVVELKPETEAYVVYPGGQSGNPGSQYYDQFVDDWAEGGYYKAWVMKGGEEKDKRVRWKMQFSN